MTPALQRRAILLALRLGALALLNAHVPTGAALDKIMPTAKRIGGKSVWDELAAILDEMGVPR